MGAAATTRKIRIVFIFNLYSCGLLRNALEKPTTLLPADNFKLWNNVPSIEATSGTPSAFRKSTKGRHSAGLCNS
jgi:hypothetical protein